MANNSMCKNCYSIHTRKRHYLLPWILVKKSEHMKELLSKKLDLVDEEGNFESSSTNGSGKN